MVEKKKKKTAYELLIVDELGYVPLSKTGVELLFETISQRYERNSTLITSNLPFDEWTEIFGSERLTGALLDRLTHHVHILEDERRQLPPQAEPPKTSLITPTPSASGRRAASATLQRPSSPKTLLPTFYWLPFTPPQWPLLLRP